MRYKVPDKWEIYSLDNIGELSAGGTPSTKEPLYWKNGDIRWMASGEIHKKRIYEVKGRITEKGHQNSNAKILPVDTVLIALAGQGKTRGTVAITKIELTTNQSVGAIQLDKGKTFSPFVFYNLDNRYQELRRISLGDGRAGLNLNILRSLKICLPPVDEQKKIAEVLSTWDQAIETVSNLINAKTKLKKGLMQKLLTGTMRFNEFKEHWADHEYDDLFETVSAKKNQVAKEKYKEIGKYPIVDQGQSRIVGYTDEDKVFKNVPIIVFGDHTRIIKWVDFPFVVGADGTQLLKTKSICDLKYGFYVFSNLRLPSLGYSRHFKVVKESTFYIPSNPKEQMKITETLSSMDNELDYLIAILEMLKNQKQGLMQKLLTGKIRARA